MKEEVCQICKKPIPGTMVGTGNGLAHPHCYERQHQPLSASSLYEVARGHGDPVLAAQVIADLVPDNIAAEIVKRFNRRLFLQWERRCEEPT